MKTLSSKLNRKDEDTSLFGRLSSQSIPVDAEAPAPIDSPEPVAEEPDFGEIEVPEEEKKPSPLASPIDTNLPAVPASIPSTQKLDEFSTKIREGLDKESQQWIKAQTDQLKQLNKEAAELYKQDKERVQTAQIAAMIGQALNQIGYGLAGMRNKTYGGPLKFDKADWESTYKNILDEYKSRLDSIKDETASETAGFKERDSQRGKLATDRIAQAEAQLRNMTAEERRAADRLLKLQDEARRRAEKEADKKEAVKRAPKLESPDKILKDSRELEGLAGQYKVAKSDKERASLLKQINVKLGPHEVPMEELETLLKKQKPGFFSKLGAVFGLGSGTGENGFSELIKSQEQKRISELNQRNKVLLGDEGEDIAQDEPITVENEPQTPQPAPASGYIMIRQPNGKLSRVPESSVERALQLGATVIE